jgi:hypothetical protein
LGCPDPSYLRDPHQGPSIGRLGGGSGGDVLAGPRAGAHTLIVCVGCEVGADGPNDGPGLVVNCRLRAPELPAAEATFDHLERWSAVDSASLRGMTPSTDPISRVACRG